MMHGFSSERGKDCLHPLSKEGEERGAKVWN